jgi:hypothetical protein
MKTRDQRDETVRQPQPQPEAAARDPRNAEAQEQVRVDSEANRQEAAR